MSKRKLEQRLTKNTQTKAQRDNGWKSNGRKQWDDFLKILKENRCQSRNLFTIKNMFEKRNKGNFRKKKNLLVKEIWKGSSSYRRKIVLGKKTQKCKKSHRKGKYVGTYE